MDHAVKPPKITGDVSLVVPLTAENFENAISSGVSLITFTRNIFDMRYDSKSFLPKLECPPVERMP